MFRAIRIPLFPNNSLKITRRCCSNFHEGHKRPKGITFIQMIVFALLTIEKSLQKLTM